MCPLNEISHSQRSLAGLEARGARARVESWAGDVGIVSPGNAAAFAQGSAVAVVALDVLEATPGEPTVELVDPMSTPRSPTREDIPAGAFAGNEESSTNYEIPTCQKLGAAHRWLGRVRSQRETYGGGENARSGFGIAPHWGGLRLFAQHSAFDGRHAFGRAEFLPADFASLDI